MKNKVISVRIPKDLYDKLATIAKKRNCSVSDIIREAITQYCNNNYPPSILDILPKLAETVNKTIKKALERRCKHE